MIFTLDRPVYREGTIDDRHVLASWDHISAGSHPGHTPNPFQSARQTKLFMMKTFVLTTLLAALAHGSPLLTERQSCPASGITTARSTEVLGKFKSARVIPDSVPEFTPTTDLRVKYGNINENLGNEFNVLREAFMYTSLLRPVT